MRRRRQENEEEEKDVRVEGCQEKVKDRDKSRWTTRRKRAAQGLGNQDKETLSRVSCTSFLSSTEIRTETTGLRRRNERKVGIFQLQPHPVSLSNFSSTLLSITYLSASHFILVKKHSISVHLILFDCIPFLMMMRISLSLIPLLLVKQKKTSWKETRWGLEQSLKSNGGTNYPQSSSKKRDYLKEWY